MGITFEAFATKNLCYQANKAMPKGVATGIVVHSTGANNPNLKRYVNAPEICGENVNKNYYDRPDWEGCPHAVIGKDKDGNVRAAQLLPYNICCWGCDSGARGSYNYNPAYLQFEICEDALTDEKYFEQAFEMAAQLCREWCDTYGISVDKIVSHKEAHALGYASNHGDPENWLTKFGKDMDWFRAKVKALGATTKATEKLYRVQIGAFKNRQNAENYKASAIKKGYSAFIVQAENGLYRVQIGAFKSRQNAVNYLEKAQADGYDGFVVEVDK